MKASDNIFPKLLFQEGAAPATPSGGTLVLYAKTDSLLYKKDDSGTETPISGNVSVAWGTITGTISSQTDLQVALDNKSGKTVSIITESSAATMVPATHSGVDRYVRASGDITFDSAQAYSAGQVYNIRAVSALDLVGTGVVLTPPSGGTLSLSAGMTVTIIMTSSTAGDVVGQTEAA